jgi:hypothetical protein
MTIHKIPFTINEETPEETKYFDAKTYLDPPRTSVGTLYREHTLLIGIVVGALIMGLLAVYFNSRNFGVLNSNISRNAELSGIMERNTETCKALVEKNAGMMEEYKANNATILKEVEEKITKRTSRVVEDKKEIAEQP